LEEEYDGAPAVIANLNPHATLEDALERYNGPELGAEVDTTTASGTPLFSFAVHFEEEADNLPPPEPLFNLYDDERSEEARAVAMTASLPFEDADGRLAEIVAVVDSGAAQCAMQGAYFRKHFPLHAKALLPTRRRFLDASGHIMPAAGRIRFKFWLGDSLLQCNVYILEQLATPFLLGTNAMLSNAIVLNPWRRTLYTDPLYPREHHGSVPLNVTGPARIGSLFCEESYDSDANDADDQPAACKCHQPYQLLYDRTAAQLMTLSAGPFSVRGPPLQCAPGQQLLAQVRAATPETTSVPTNWSTLLRTARAYDIPAKARGFGMLLSFDEHPKEPNISLELEPLPSFRAAHPQ
jgi:hypothetical protein